MKSLLLCAVLLAAVAACAQSSGGNRGTSGGSGTVGTCGAAGNAYYAAGGTTTSCDTSITDNGSGTFNAVGFSASGNVTTTGTGLVVMQAGSITAASLTWAGDTAGAGIYRSAANVYSSTNGTNSGFTWGNGVGARVNSAGCIGFASSTNSSGAFDTGMSRIGAARIGIGNCNNAGVVDTKRYTVDGATNLVSGDFVLGAGWGSTAAVNNIAGKDSSAIFVVNPSGTGIAANPTIQFTFHDGAWNAVPVCHLIQNSGNDIFSDTTLNTTGFNSTVNTWIWNGTPTTAKTYGFIILCTGT